MKLENQLEVVDKRQEKVNKNQFPEIAWDNYVIN